MTERRVVKLGGSLFGQAGVFTRLDRWLHASRTRDILIVGGGRAADAVRARDARYKLDAATAHWLAIEAMSGTARQAAARMPRAALIDDWTALGRSEAPLCIFECGPFLRRHEASYPAPCLPRDWSCTSDSIAARVAECLGGVELVLLKSAPRPAGDWREAAEAGYVDPHFPRAIERLPRVSAVNL